MADIRAIAKIKPMGDFAIADVEDIDFSGIRLDVVINQVKQTLTDIFTAIEENENNIRANSGKIDANTAAINDLRVDLSTAETAIASKASQSEVDAVKADVATKASAENVSQVQADMAVQKSRMDQLVGTVPAGSADEIADARVTADGKTEANLGNAIRNQISSVKGTINKATVDVGKDVIYGNFNALITAATNRAISQVLKINQITSISVSDGYLFCLFCKSGSQVMYWTGTGYARQNALYTTALSNIDEIVNSAYKDYRICIKKESDANISVEECALNAHINMMTDSVVYDSVKQIKTLVNAQPELVQGYISSTGTLLDSKTRVATDYIFPEAEDLYITVDGNYVIKQVNRYNRFVGHEIVFSNVLLSEFKLEGGYSYRVTVCDKKDDTKYITPAEVSKHLRVNTASNHYVLRDYENTVFNLRQGYVDNSGTYQSNLNTRVSTYMINAESDVEVKVSGDYAIRAVDVYKRLANYIGKSLNGVNVKTYILPAGNRYVVTFCKDSDPSAAITVSDVERNVVISTKITTESENIRAIFRKHAYSGKHFKVKMVGDSILQGVGGSNFDQNGETIITYSGTTWKRNPDGYCWGNLFKALLESKYDCEVVNNGCRGTASSFLINNWDKLVDADDDLIICAYGTNDRAFTRDPRVFEANIRIIKQKAEDEGKDVIFLSGIPAGLNNELCLTHNYDNIYYHMEDVDRLICEATKGNYISLFNEVQEWISCTEKNLLDYLDENELHPNDALYWKMHVWICKALGVAPKIKNATW